jgi:hypothetical protein
MIETAVASSFADVTTRYVAAGTPAARSDPGTATSTPSAKTRMGTVPVSSESEPPVMRQRRFMKCGREARAPPPLVSCISLLDGLRCSVVNALHRTVGNAE